jgi:RNA processing factor Prp31
MSVVEDSRKLMQDFLAPEVRSIAARLDALEKRFDESERRHDKLSEKIEKRFESMSERFDKQFHDAEKQAEKRHDISMLLGSLANYNELNSVPMMADR